MWFRAVGLLLLGSFVSCLGVVRFPGGLVRLFYVGEGWKRTETKVKRGLSGNTYWGLSGNPYFSKLVPLLFGYVM